MALHKLATTDFAPAKGPPQTRRDTEQTVSFQTRRLGVSVVKEFFHSRHHLIMGLGEVPELGSGQVERILPVELPAGPVELVLVLRSASQSNGVNYDFTDIVGRLQWKGDALRGQRNLRDG